jgi:toxin HigB-1
MIQSFYDRDTRALFEDDKCHRQWRAFKNVAVRKLDMLDAAVVLSDLASPPGNRLEALTRDRQGQHSIRINDQWRICFVWGASGPERVEITDYH